MATLSDKEIAAFVTQAGFTGGGATMAVAIALAESGGNPKAQGFNKSGNKVLSVDRGLWQFNSVYHAEVTDACAYDPRCAAQAVYRVSSHGTNWQAWSTYMNGSYRAYLGRAQSATAQRQPHSFNPGDSLAPPPTPLSTGTPAASTANSIALSELLAAKAPQTATYQTLGDTSGKNADIMRPYKVVLALAIMFGFLYVISQISIDGYRAGYAAMYYAEVLILLFLFATQAQYFKEALLPLAPQQAETPTVLQSDLGAVQPL